MAGNAPPREYRCAYSTIQINRNTGESRAKCVPRTRPGESPAFWQELGWAKNWITLTGNNRLMCEKCKRFKDSGLY
jgi:hypothetical protein